MKKSVVFGLAVVIAAAFFFVVFGSSTFEAQQAEAAAPTVESLQVGSVIQFGGYDWRVLDVQGNKALIITEHIIEQRPYNVDNKDVTWETCTLREYLNGEFLQKFSAEDQARIAETRINNPNNQQYGTNGGNDTNDKIFLLSIEEANRYFSSDSERIAKVANGTASWWWLRSPGLLSFGAAGVHDDGLVNVAGGVVSDGGGVRPALYLNL